MSLLHHNAGMTAALNRMADNEVRDSNQEETNENFDSVNTQLATMRKEMTERDTKAAQEKEEILQACQTLTTTVKKLQESQALKEEDKEEVTANLFDEKAPLSANKIPHNDEEADTVNEKSQTTAAPIVQGGVHNVSSSIDCVDSKAPRPEIDAKETEQSTSKKIKVQTTPFNKTNLQQARPSSQVKIQAPPASADRGGVKRSLTNLQTPISKRSRRGTHAESAHIDRRRKGLGLETDKAKSRTMNVKNETSYQRTYATRSSSKEKPWFDSHTSVSTK